MDAKMEGMFIIIVIANLLAFVAEALYIPFKGADNFLILSMLALGQSFANTILAAIGILFRWMVKTDLMKQKVSVIINAFWLSAGLSVLLAVGYCFVGVPLSR